MLQKSLESVPPIQHNPSLKSNSILLFELSTYGHHTVYIRHLVEHWLKNHLPGSVHIVVAPRFFEKCADLVARVSQYPSAGIAFLPLSEAEEASLTTNLKGFINRKIRAWQEWHLICAYARKTEATHCFLPSFDFFQWPLIFGQKPPCPISGIYFKPTFHYGSFAAHVSTPSDHLRQWQEKLTLAAIFQQPHIHRLFCLDPFAAEALSRSHKRSHIKVSTLADPVSHYPDRAEAQTRSLRKRLEISENRRIFLIFGDLSERKGVRQLLEATTLLSSSLCQALCILIIGRCNSTEKAHLHSKVQQIRQAKPIQIIEHYEFVNEEEVQAYFQLADVVLAPYQRHVGMSGILLQAAAAGKPVISSNYGLMGELVTQYELGLAVDSTQPPEIAKALTRMLKQPVQKFFNSEKLRLFSEQNTVEKFTSAIFEGVMQ